MGQQVADRDGQVMVGVHQAQRFRDDPVAVGVGIVAKGEVEAVLELDQARHRIGAGAIHADLAVVVERHESEGRVDRRIGDGDIQAVGVGDRLPVMDGRAAERVDAQLQAGRANRLHVDDVRQVVDVRSDEIDLARRVRPDRPGERNALDLGVAGSEQGVGAVLDPRRDVGVGRSAVGRVVLEAAVGGGVVRRRDHDAVALVVGAAAVVDEDRVRDDGRRRHAVVALEDRLDAFGRQNLERRPLGRAGEGVRVLAQKKRAVDRMRRGGSRRSPW